MSTTESQESDSIEEYEFTFEDGAGLEQNVEIEAESRADALNTLAEWNWYEVGVEDTSGAWTNVTVAAPDYDTAEERGVEKAENEAFNKIDSGSAYDGSKLGAIAQLNDDWTDGREEWGENFIVRVEVEGVESVGDMAAARAMEALVPYIADEDSMFEFENRPDDPGELSFHAARPAEWTAPAEYLDTETKLTLTLVGSEGLLDAEFDTLEEKVADTLGDEWFGQAIPSGPHENPYDEDYDWWAHEGRVYVFGHEIELTCGNCGDELSYDSMYGNGEFHFVCPNDVERSVTLAPGPAKPTKWVTFFNSFEASIERDGDSWRIDATDEDESFVVELQAPTLADQLPASDKGGDEA